MSEPSGFLVTEKLVKRFDEAVAVDEVSLSIGQGEIFALLGPNGAVHNLVHQPRYVADDLLTLKYGGGGRRRGWCWDARLHVPGRNARSASWCGCCPTGARARHRARRVPVAPGLSPAVRHFLDFLGDAMPGRSSLATREALQAR